MIRLLHGDCREILKTLPDQSVHCVVTSPPYWGLRDYGVAGQIGMETSMGEYLDVMVEVFREVRRVLRKDGTVFLNLGDSYFGGGRGGGGSFESERRAWRAIPCDTSDKEPEDYQARDCFCQNLCDACRVAYRIGKSHSGRSPASMPPFSNFESSRERMELPSGHLPMSDSTAPDDHSLVAMRDQRPLPDRADGQPVAFQASMPPEFLRRLQEGHHPSGQISECQLCGCSLRDCVPASSHMAACTCDKEAGASVVRTTGRGASGLAYLDSTTAFLKPKDLCGIPWRVAFALQADGWYLRQDLIWSKPNPMPESVTDRCTKSHEYIFLLSKSARYYYDADAIAEEGSGRTPGNRSYKYDGLVGHETKHGILAQADIPQMTRNKRSVWEVATAPFSEAHFATFPPALIEPCILAGCPEFTCGACGTVLDRRYAEARSSTNGKAISSLQVVRSQGNPRPQEPHAGLLQQGVCGEVVSQEPTNDKGFYDQHQGLSSPAEIGPSKCDSLWLRDGTSLGDGASSGTAAVGDGGGSPQGRQQAKQRTGKFGSHDKDGARQNAQAAHWDDPLPTLQCEDYDFSICPHCRAALNQVGIKPGLVLDCFGGAGTTGLVADRLGRNAILIELNPQYAQMAERRLKNDAGMFAEVNQCTANDSQTAAI
jgi:DNA modification methylase